MRFRVTRKLAIVMCLECRAWVVGGGGEEGERERERERERETPSRRDVDGSRKVLFKKRATVYYQVFKPDNTRLRLRGF